MSLISYFEVAYRAFMFYIITTLEDIFICLWSYLISYNMWYHSCQVYGIEYLQVFEESQHLYGSVTLVLRTALLDEYNLPPTTRRGFLSHSPMTTYNTMF